ncbi:PerC family transcriptional regulator [Cronobacter turicensis]|uniref:PerC family transcriptional regulator n=1 Tax=Cronobacter turicensis TaxID=413502 RepID=UPI0011AD5B3A|nr:PerC family transcriptional regulator [Cronobacter turicensis]EKY3120770.1 PerC family transcriptional regulator [Cronobacter turicensis]ELU8452890.1 PerC family transcriptional regulator [Cronobacter turicensis]ELY4112558.1 PerC family transcriptional regulator [Cronobacter turicensis]ELY4215769.1 PerC family transcriptional regulator [Cronobacter turicensis]EMA1789810.1 PerC family transcriptional regulator [Cronobacter turicensis]
MSRTESITPHDTFLLNDSIVRILERAGPELWRRTAFRWLVIFDLLKTDEARERTALRREACLLMATKNVDSQTGDRHSKSYKLLKEAHYLDKFRSLI